MLRPASNGSQAAAASFPAHRQWTRKASGFSASGARNRVHQRQASYSNTAAAAANIATPAARNKSLSSSILQSSVLTNILLRHQPEHDPQREAGRHQG